MSTTQKIRYSDCDPQGIVFNGNYARYWDDALTDWFEEAGLGGAELGGSGVDIVTARIEMDFKASASLGDLIETSIAVERFGNTSMTVGFTTTRTSDGTVVTEGREILVFVDPADFRPTAVPEPVRAVLSGNRKAEESVH
ncbi:MAG TPA: thioesterase family protein [Acidimicrobiia bacterium]|nr:thioesterase family protein [Acidimicrobiia bacterium]